MTQRNVERLIGRLLTDEEFRERFAESPERTIEGLVAGGWELNATERSALATLDRNAIAAFARTVDSRIRKVPLLGVRPAEDDGKE